MQNKKLKTILRIVTITLALIVYCSNHVFGFDLDLTVDDDIRKNYNSSKLIKDTHTEDTEEQLPALPAKLLNTSMEYSAKRENYQSAPVYNVNRNSGTKISKGTSFNVVNTAKISDWQAKGTIVKFKTKAPLYKKKYTIPAGTTFTGEIIEVHKPQVSCNGGLVVIRIRSMSFGAQSVPINAYVTRADDKFIFLNNIKGERTYLKTVWKKGNWGRTLFSRMLTLTVNLGGDSSTLILSPFPFLYGSICLGANTILSPVTAFFQKGGHVSINSGSNFRIKLLDDAYIN